MTIAVDFDGTLQLTDTHGKPVPNLRLGYATRKELADCYIDDKNMVI